MDRDGPHVSIEPLPVRSRLDADTWAGTWRIENVSQRPTRILAAWLPHGRYRSDRCTLEPPRLLTPGESTLLDLPVHCSEEPGTEIENAFLILQVTWGEESWRVLARLRVIVDAAGTPQNRCELITTQPIGFARQLS